MKKILALIILVLAVVCPSEADEVLLKNGDRITGDIYRVTDKVIRIKTPAMGSLTVKQEFVESYVKDDQKEIVKAPEPEAVDKEKDLWTRTISFGYSQTEGNTEDSEGRLKFKANRKTDRDEFTFLTNGYYSSSNGRMDGRKYYGKIRYAFSFTEEKKWYNFYKFEGNQDRFANVDYRLTPSVGVGYWVSDELPFKVMAEIAFGYEHTNFRGSAKSTNEAVMVPRGFFEWQVMDNLLLSEDVTIYPSLSEFGEYRFISETALSSKINDHLTAKISFLDEYDSDPAGTAKKNDTKLISSLEYEF